MRANLIMVLHKYLRIKWSNIISVLTWHSIIWKKLIKNAFHEHSTAMKFYCVNFFVCFVLIACCAEESEILIWLITVINTRCIILSPFYSAFFPQFLGIIIHILYSHAINFYMIPVLNFLLSISYFL